VTDRRKKPALAEGLAAGLGKADLPGVGDALGRGLLRVQDAWLPKRKLAIPQLCPLCGTGPYSSTDSLKQHLFSAHPAMSDRERSFTLDSVRRAAVRQAMNGAPRAP